MDEYIAGNKAAWEEAFDNRDASWGADITERIQNEDYPFFEKEMVDILRGIDTEGKTIGQFCCNNGIVVTGLQEFDHDISGGFTTIDKSGFPLSMILQGKKRG